MKWLLIILGTLAALVLLLVVIGLMLPREHQATSSIELSRPADTVWAAIRDFGNLPAYWPELRRSERVADVNGHEAWAQTMKSNFTMTIEVVDEAPPERLGTHIVAPPGAPFGGSWIYRLAATPGGVRVTVTEDGWVSNPIFRVVSRLMGHHATLDSYLRALSRHFGAEATPEHPNK